MRRWMFILLGGFGAALAVSASFMLCMSAPLFQNYAMQTMVGEYSAIGAGIVLSIVGFVQGRRAGELDISQYTKTPRRDYGVAGTEIDFSCPVCHKGYRASPLLAGKPFTCRDCREMFDVPRMRQLAGPAASQR